jgi:Primase C terminal 1 (PriCT-1)
MLNTYLNLLFNKGELICPGHSQYDTRLCDLSTMVDSQFIALNPLHTSRKDSNCVAFRNFLIEIDQLPLIEQRPYVESFKMPYSTAVYSGNKSHHFVICLEDGFKTIKHYRYAAKWLHNIMEKADHSTRNPSRFTRLPGAYNAKTGKLQKLMYCGVRIPNKQFEAFLRSHSEKQPKLHTTHTRPYYSPGTNGILSWHTRAFLLHGAPEGQRNNRLYSAACDAAINGFDLEWAYAELVKPLERDPDFDVSSCHSTILSAYNRFTRS